MQQTPELIKKINEVFHDEEARTYDERHPEILQAERARWQPIVETIRYHLRSLNRPAVIVDLGTGTGFVPSMLLPILQYGDRLTCTDISAAMLARTEQLIATAWPEFHVDFYLTDVEQFDPGVEVDVFTINSTLHHLPDPTAVFGRIANCLRPGGLLVVAHEPSKRFASSRVLRGLHTSVSALRSVASRLRATLGDTRDYLCLQRAVYQRLLREGIVTQADDWVSPANIQRFVDIHSPTAGDRGLDPKEGFDPTHLHPILEQWQCTFLDTWNFAPALGEWRGRSLVEALLKKLYPRYGLLFTIVLQRTQTIV